jgi:AAA+ superfamily predicted ATPase
MSYQPSEAVKRVQKLLESMEQKAQEVERLRAASASAEIEHQRALQAIRDEAGAKVGTIRGTYSRLLEYYAGILFLTTNRATIIDDAILSRCTAHVRYDVPEEELRAAVWRVLLAQYQVKMSDKEIGACIERFPRVSGRSVRQLIRLAKIMADRRKTRVTPELIGWAGQYQDFAELEGEPQPEPRTTRGEKAR